MRATRTAPWPTVPRHALLEVLTARTPGPHGAVRGRAHGEAPAAGVHADEGGFFLVVFARVSRETRC